MSSTALLWLAVEKSNYSVGILSSYLANHFINGLNKVQDTLNLDDWPCAPENSTEMSCCNTKLHVDLMKQKVEYFDVWLYKFQTLKVKMADLQICFSRGSLSTA